jgi:hypothetical protein
MLTYGTTHKSHEQGITNQVFGRPKDLPTKDLPTKDITKKRRQPKSKSSNLESTGLVSHTLALKYMTTKLICWLGTIDPASTTFDIFGHRHTGQE